MMTPQSDIIVAPATLTGGAIAIIRLSGKGSVALCDTIFKGRKGRLSDCATHTLHYGEICDNDRIIDDVLVSLFLSPHSYTGEESVEISCHGSHYIVQEIIALLLERGARTAQAGEFTTRAYLAGRMDLSQAEAVADMIASSSKAQHTMATTQMRGGYSSRLADLRAQLLELAALLELELDFSQEEVEFADRSHLEQLLESLREEVEKLSSSFATGNAIKKGVQVAIIGKPNVGKSTLLNCLLGDQRAMVSEIAGTTRDLIEEEIIIDGITFRFIDTAGVHTTHDKLELMGIERTHQAIEKAQIIIHLTEPQTEGSPLEIELKENQKLLNVVNKIDTTTNGNEGNVGKNGENGVVFEKDEKDKGDKDNKDNKDGENDENDENDEKKIYISAKEEIGIDTLLEQLRAQIDTTQLYEGAPIVSSLRHYELLTAAQKGLKSAQTALTQNIPTDLLCQDIREVLHNIGAITGTITTNDILGEIFSKFCIGK